ncbi:MAG TPA: SHOCT domain-containing protein [Solirubrobacteraceae bacterium]|nr:SHOCT domain-containing protein [Solirubrobacteraceae bacterium]
MTAVLFAFPWGVAGALLWLLPIALIVIVVSRVRTSAPPSPGPAVGLLAERYARGEITREEFLERRDVLGGGSAGT